MNEFTLQQILEKVCVQVQLASGTFIKTFSPENANYHLSSNEWRLFTRTVNREVELFELQHADTQGNYYSEFMKSRPGWETYQESDIEFYKGVFLHWIEKITERVRLGETDNLREQQN